MPKQMRWELPDTEDTHKPDATNQINSNHASDAAEDSSTDIASEATPEMLQTSDAAASHCRLVYGLGNAAEQATSTTERGCEEEGEVEEEETEDRAACRQVAFTMCRAWLLGWLA